MGKQQRIKPQLVKGMRDQLGEPILRRQEMLTTIRSVFECFGFRPLETPVVEFARTLTGSRAGETSQRIFTWNHEEDQVELGLRFDLTVPLARFVAANPQLRRPFKRYQSGPVFRVDKPGAGRFREFTQFDIDTVGTPSMMADAEILVAMGAALEELGLPNYTVRWNHRGVLNAVLLGLGVPSERIVDVIRVLDKLDKVQYPEIEKELTGGRVDDDSGAKIPGIGLGPDVAKRIILGFVVPFMGVVNSEDRSVDEDEVVAELEKLVGEDRGGCTAMDEVHQLRQYVEAMGVNSDRIRLAPWLARGMDYYTGPIFEATLDDLPHFGSIMGGGRYNELLSRFSGEHLPAVGASIGVDRLLAALEEAGQTQGRAHLIDVLVTTMDKNLLPAYLGLVSELRAAGLRAEVYLKPKARLGDQLKYASDWDIPFAVIMGEDEVNAGEVTVKDLDAGKAASEGMEDREQWVEERPGQFQIARSELAAKLGSLLDS